MKWGGTKAREDKMKGEQRKWMETSGSFSVWLHQAVTVSVSRWSLRACTVGACIFASFCVSGVCVHCTRVWAVYQVISLSPKYLYKIEKKTERITGREWKGKIEWERGREGLEPQSLLLLASTQRFSVRQGARLQGHSLLLTSASSSTKSHEPTLAHAQNTEFSKDSYSHKFRYDTVRLKQPSTVDKVWQKSAFFVFSLWNTQKSVHSFRAL